MLPANPHIRTPCALTGRPSGGLDGHGGWAGPTCQAAGRGVAVAASARPRARELQINENDRRKIANPDFSDVPILPPPLKNIPNVYYQHVRLAYCHLRALSSFNMVNSLVYSLH